MISGNLLLIYVNKSPSYWNQDNYIWGSSVADNFSNHSSICLQEVFSQFPSFDSVFNFLKEYIQIHSISHIIYFPGYCDYEWSLNVVIPLKKYFNKSTLLIPFLLDELIGFSTHFRYLAFYSDAVISTEIVNLGFYNSIGCSFVFFNSSYGKYESLPFVEKPDFRYDICFIGDLSGKSRRSSFIKQALSNFPNIYLAGSGTSRGPISEAEYSDVVSSSRITLNFTGTLLKSPWLSKTEGTIRYGQNKGRILESIFLGSAPLSEYSYTAQHAFNNLLLTFSDNSQMIRHLNYLIQDDDYYLNYRQKLYNYSLSHLSEAVQLSHIVATLSSLQPNQYGYPAPSIDLLAFNEVRCLRHRLIFFTGQPSPKSFYNLFLHIILRLPYLFVSSLIFLFNLLR